MLYGDNSNTIIFTEQKLLSSELMFQFILLKNYKSRMILKYQYNGYLYI